MMKAVIAVLSIAAFASDTESAFDFTDVVEEIETIDRSLETTPPGSDAARELEHRRDQRVDAIAGQGDSRSNSPETQIAVTAALSRVNEGARALPYADRGLALAEGRGDPRLLKAALLAGSDAYLKAKRYDEAYERAQRVLKMEPGHKGALALAMQAKGRSGSPSGGWKDAVPAGAAAGGPAKAATAKTGAANGATGDGADESAKVYPGMDEATRQRKELIAEGRRTLQLDPPKALKIFERAAGMDPKDAEALAMRALAKSWGAQYSGAIADANAAIALDPKAADAYAARAVARQNTGRPAAEVLADYAAAARFDKSYASRYEEALAALGESAQDAPQGMGTVRKRNPFMMGAFIVACSLVLFGLIGAFLRKRTGDTPPPTPR